MDLLKYAQSLVARGNTNSQTQAHTAYLQTLVKQENPRKAEIREIAINNSQTSSKISSSNAYLLIGGLILLGMAILVIGYWLGKNKKQSKNKLYFDEN